MHVPPVQATLQPETDCCENRALESQGTQPSFSLSKDINYEQKARLRAFYDDMFFATLFTIQSGAV